MKLNKMTKEELIEALSKIEENLEISVVTEWGIDSITDVKVENTYIGKRIILKYG